MFFMLNVSKVTKYSSFLTIFIGKPQLDDASSDREPQSRTLWLIPA